VLELVRSRNDRAADTMMLNMAPYQFVRVQFRRIRREVEQAKPPVGSLNKLFDCYSSMNRMAVHNEKYRAVCLQQQPFEEIDKDRACKFSPGAERKRRSPLGLIAESRLMLNRAPVDFTTGLCPIGAHVVPL
jgi:hypothetical protein